MLLMYFLPTLTFAEVKPEHKGHVLIHEQKYWILII